VPLGTDAAAARFFRRASRELPVTALTDEEPGGVRRTLYAKRAGATITEVEGSHVIMISQPQIVVDVILKAVAVVGQSGVSSRS
jgi:hypothetical protein